MTNWNSFTVFEGDCILNKHVFGVKTDFEFVKWVRQLRAAPLRGGIPKERVEDVTNLLNKFFPDVVPNPETVTYGESKLNINDGPSALGYIFSIAASKAASPRTYINYAVPLLAIYARCLYLAYHVHGRWGLQAVPYMANCMYTILSGTKPAFHLLLGSTYQTLGDLKASKIQMMNRFRRGIVDGGLGQCEPPHTLPLEPRVFDGAVLALRKYLCGTLPKKVGTDLWIPGTATVATPSTLVSGSTAKRDFNAFANLWEDQWSTANKTEIRPLQLSKAMSSNALIVAGGPSIKQAIQTALGRIIEKRWEAGYDREEAWADILSLMKEFYTQVYIPHMFHAQEPGPNQPPPKKRRLSKPPLEPDITRPQVSMPGWAAKVEAEVDAILVTQKDLILDKLDHLYSWISNGDAALSDGGPDRPRYGRCAETHPLVGLMPNHIPDRVIPPAANPSPVRGLAVQILRFDDLTFPSLNVGTCNSLSLDFTSANLNAFHAAQTNNPVFRLPCKNCTVLLEAMDVPIGDDAYDADMKALNPFGFNSMK